MSKIFECGDIVIHVWPKDHKPVQCHIFLGDDVEVKVSLPDYRLTVVKGYLYESEVSEILDLVKGNRHEIGRTWRKFNGN
jgi:hypothetical protein